MKSRILNMLLLLVLCTLTIAVSNAQIASNELNSTLTGYQDDIEAELEQRINRGDLLKPTGASAYDTYLIYTEKYPSDHSFKRKLKRSLVAALVDASDQALTEYYDEGGDFIFKYMSMPSHADNTKDVPVDLYYFVAADLLGEGHSLDGSIKSKGYFIEALKFRYIEKRAPEAVMEKLKLSIALNPNASYTYNELGNFYFNIENYSLACENYNLAILLNSYWEIPKEKLKLAEEAMFDSKN